ncbi:ankyrin repeat protein [Colletotrichum tofieldiae]|nr:ankyrin repeat protein [Colletotrichum tofieldiae]GKT75243.1 ankyrin repeat protein [Colletotrichum tofieldiae]
MAKDALMGRLNTSNYESHKTRNPLPVKGTCIWIFNHPKYQSWLNTSGSSLLWISADPGCGKSVLASFLIDEFTTSPKYKGTNVCYFFFKSDNADQSDVLNGIRAILYQLYTQQQDLIPFGAPELQGHNPENVDKLWAAFVTSVEHATARPTICILDGIDECEPRPRGLLLRCISDHFASQDRLPKTQQASKLRVLIASRPENQIKVSLDRRPRANRSQTLDTPSEPYDMIRLRAEDETEAISDDVSKVIKARIDDLIDRGFPVVLLENLQIELIKRADRTFLWVSLVLSLLEEKVEGGASRRELDDILRTRDIYSIYAELLASRPDLPKARKMLNLILAAAKPLTVEEVSIALAVVTESEQPSHRQGLPRKAKGPGKLTFNDVEYELVYPFENHLKHICGHFVRIIKNRVYLVHETAREFLLEPNDSRHRSQQNNLLSLSSYAADGPGTAFQHTFSLIEAHALLLDICVAFLYCLAKQTKTSQPGEVSSEARAFFQYAARSWPIHHHRARKRLDLLDSRYYQNLCHPLFPGFHRWLEEFWAPELPPHPSTSAPDDIQDYYIDLFNLENLLPSLCDTEDQGSDNESSDDELKPVGADLEESEKQKPRGTPFDRADHHELRLPSWRGVSECLSSNPGSLSNHYFPLKVDGGGMVSLDFRRGPGEGPPEYRQ